MTRIIIQLDERFDTMSVKRGKNHTFLGMDVNFKDDGKIGITSKKYLEECIESFGEPLNRKPPTPSKGDLFDIDSDSPRLCKAKSSLYHHIVAKLLYVAKCSRPDIDTTIAFMCIRVSKSTEEDWIKLRRLLEYIQSTINDERIVGVKDLCVMKTYVNALFAVHQDMKGYTGRLTTFGSGMVHHKLSKQSLNTKSSTESELVGASDYLLFTIWVKRFLQEQGYHVKESIFYQDNASAIKLENSGRMSSGKKTRHADIRYFFIKDVVE